MFHLLVMACLDPTTCAERWLPAADRPDAGACLAAAAAVAPPWLAAHGMTGGAQRCVPTEALPALPLEPVAPGVWVHRGAIATAGPDNGGRIANLGVIAGPRGTLLVDTGGSRAEAEALLAAALRLGQPVTLAVMTHVHPDHALGAELLAEAGVPTIGHARLPEAIAARAGTYRQNYRAVVGEAAWAGSDIAPPARTLAAPERVDFGGDQVLLTPLAGAAHTDTDLTVWHPASGTLFTGDLAFRGLTPVLDGSILGWQGWLAASPAAVPEPVVPRHVVPGHGAPAPTWEEGTADTRSFLDQLAAAVRAQVAGGAALSAAVPAVAEALRPAFGTLADFDGTVRRDAAAAFKELEWE